jgi:RNA polymerase sigma-B factor
VPDPPAPRSGPSPSAEETLARYRETGDRRLRNRVVDEHRWLAVTIARSFRTGSEPLEDLIQVACIALVKAAERFDPAFGVEFKSYAAVTARGELRRYYRDATWAIRVPRRLQELRYEMRAATEVLRERLQRSPDTSELAAYLHVDVDEIVDCMCADSNFRPRSLDHPDAADQAVTGSAAGDGEYAGVESADAFAELTRRLPPRLQRIVEMRYVHEMKQSDIAAVMGVSQVQISRLLRDAADRLRPVVAHRRQRVDDVV